MTIKLSKLKNGSVDFPRDYTRSYIRANGLRFREVDIETGSPKELQRRLARNIEDAGYSIVEDGIDAQKGGWGESVGDISGRLIGHRDEKVEHAMTFSTTPYKNVGYVGFSIAALIGIVSLEACGADEGGLWIIVALVAAIASLAAGNIKQQNYASIYASTVLRVRTDGEATETRTDEQADGKRVGRTLVSARMALAMNVEVVLAVNLSQVPAAFSQAVLADATPFLTDEGGKALTLLTQRATGDLTDIAERIERFSQVA